MKKTFDFAAAMKTAALGLMLAITGAAAVTVIATRAFA